MNVNQLLLNKRKNNARNRPVYKATLMGPPLKPAPICKKKESTRSSSTKCFNELSTIRSFSTSTSGHDSELHKCVIALTEGRGQARCEVGIASMDLTTPSLVLCQISDTHDYINTITKINILNPTEIIVPSTFLEGWNNRLIETIRKQFPVVKLIGAPRKTFSNSNGMERIVELCLPSINAVCIGLRYRSYAVSAASALLTYLQNSLAIYYNSQSINVVYQEAEGFAIVDVFTADQLELVCCAKPAQASRYATLFGVLNRCFTPLGVRALRSSILQPPCHIPYIEERLDCVSELMKYPEKLASIQAVLQKLKNVGQLLSITSLTSYVTDDTSNSKLNYLLVLSSLLDLISPLKDSLDGYKSQFLVEFRNSLESDNFNNIKELLSTMIHPSAKFAKGEDGIYQRCFAIKPEINGLLDLVRRIYSERLEDMREYVKHLGIKHNLPLTLNNNNAKGYHIVMKLTSQQKRSMDKSDLPPQFIQVYRLAGSFTFKTMDLIDYSTRLDDILDEILKISNIMIQDILTELKKFVGFFFKLCEDVARLDMLQSLATVSRDNKYTRPKFGEFTEVKDAQHPMLAFLCNDPFIENPISASKDYNVNIITGPNGAGKSIYIRQTILLQVMAQVGCYVPATSAIFRPADRMFARVYLEDNLECGASAFTLEMKEVCYMLNVVTDNSLYIIDELCRSTSLEEGTALAMAICERFCNTSAFVYFTTHFTLIAKLRDMYLNVKTWKMETVASGDNLRSFSLKFKYKLSSGVTQLKRYGIYLVKAVWPESTMETVYELLENTEPEKRPTKCVPIDDKIRMKYDLESKLRMMKTQSPSPDRFNRILNDYRNGLCSLGVDVDINVTTSSEKNNQDYSQNQDLQDTIVSDSSTYRNFRRSIDENSEMAAKLIPEVQLDVHSNESVYFTPQSVTDNNISMNLLMEDDDDTESKMMSLMDDLESCDLIDNSAVDWDDDSFLSEKKSNNTADESFTWVSENADLISAGKDDLCHFPNVIIREGPNDPSVSSQSQRSDNLDEISISYSPVSSPMIRDDKFVDGTTLNLDSESATAINEISSNKNPENASESVEVITDRSTSENSLNVEARKIKEKPVIEDRSSSDNTSKRYSAKIRHRFVPPKKLTKREIKEEFSKQDRKLYEESLANKDYSSYVNRILTRPSVKQLQNAQHLVVGRKTASGGVEVIPLDQEPSRKRKKTELKRLTSSTSFSASIFSDKNAKPFEEFINSSQKNVNFFKFQPYSNNDNGNVFQSSETAFNVEGIFEDAGKEVSFNLSLSRSFNQTSSQLNNGVFNEFSNLFNSNTFEMSQNNSFSSFLP